MKPFNISSEAVDQLRILRQGADAAQPDDAVRLYIAGFGYSGLDWGFSLDAFDADKDAVCEYGDFRVIMAAELLEAVGGIDISYETDADTDGEGGFLITPLAPEFEKIFTLGGCGGCGGDCSSCRGCGGGGCGGDCGSCGGCP